MAGVEQGNVSNEEFMEEVARYECVYHRNSKDFKDKNKKANCWKKIGEKFNLSAAEAVYGRPQVLVSSRIFCEPKTDVFDGFDADDDVA